MSFLDVQKEYAKRARKTATTFGQLNLTCQHVLATMFLMNNKLRNAVYTKWGLKEMPRYQQFASIYFIKNMTYLRAAYLLASEGSCGPSLDLQRTIHETILRGYLFIVNKKEANRLYSFIEGTISKEEKDVLRKRKFYPFDYLVNQLYDPKSRKSHKKFFKLLCRYSHPSISGVMADIRYSKEGVKDCLKTILALAYGTIQMMAEGFFDFLDSDLKNIIRQSLKEIADFLGEIPIFEPDQNRWTSRIRLKKGNFLTILGKS